MNFKTLSLPRVDSPFLPISSSADESLFDYHSSFSSESSDSSLSTVGEIIPYNRGIYRKVSIISLIEGL